MQCVLQAGVGGTTGNKSWERLACPVTKQSMAFIAQHVKNSVIEILSISSFHSLNSFNKNIMV